MSTKRPKALRWIGDMLPDGRPVAFIQIVEPRDHDEAETAALSDEQIALALHSGLYEAVDGKAAKTAKDGES